MRFLNISKCIFCMILLMFSAFSFADEISDSNITYNVMNNVTKDKDLSDQGITISTKDGVVYLEGQVKTDNDADALIQISQNVPGVKDVDTHLLSVKASLHPLEDTTITAKIKGLFLREKLFNPHDIAAVTIKVETTNGAVTLTGSADNQKQVATAVNLAEKVKGVKSVQTNIRVKENNPT